MRGGAGSIERKVTTDNYDSESSVMPEAAIFSFSFFLYLVSMTTAALRQIDSQRREESKTSLSPCGF